MNFIIAFVYFLCALIFLLLIGVLVYFGTADSPVWKIWYKRVSRLLTVLAVFYVVLTGVQTCALPIWHLEFYHSYCRNTVGYVVVAAADGFQRKAGRILP